MYKEYKRNILICLILVVCIIAWNRHLVNLAVIENSSDININVKLGNEDFEFIFEEPIFYPDEEILYFTVNQSLINPLYIGGVNTLIIEDESENEVINVELEEGLNYTTLEVNADELKANEYYHLSIFAGDTLLADSIKMTSNIISYEDLSDYAEEGKSNKEKKAEIKYFIYEYQNDPLLEIDDLSKYDTATEFNGSLKDQHDKLCDILDNLEYDEGAQDSIIEYYKGEIPNETYQQYIDTKVLSEKQVLYGEIMRDVEYNLQVEIVDLENQLQDKGYVNTDDISDLEAGRNLLEQRDALQGKLEEYNQASIGVHSDEY